MKRRTRFLALLLAACMTAGMAACGSNGAKTENKDTDTKKEAQNTEEKMEREPLWTAWTEKWKFLLK